VELREQVITQVEANKDARLTAVLEHIDIPSSSWYRKAKEPGEKQKPGPPPKPIDPRQAALIHRTAMDNPWYGYKKIAVICRRTDAAVTNRATYRVMKANGLLRRHRRARKAGLYQANKLYELLPKAPNELWQMDVTYIHIPGCGWRYAVTVIDYYSRYLLAMHLTDSYSAREATFALDLARIEAEDIHGPLRKRPFLVTDNGSSFIAKRFISHIDQEYSHVRIQYRTPTQLGLLERFHQTLKDEEVYWRLYDDVRHAKQCLDEFHQRYNDHRPHWALVHAEGGDPLTPSQVYRQGMAIRLPRWQTWARTAKESIEKQLQETA
jgi:transposase InsO family protein